jgi:hypothetical protein
VEGKNGHEVFMEKGGRFGAVSYLRIPAARHCSRSPFSARCAPTSASKQAFFR